MSTVKADLLTNRLGTKPPAVTKADFVKVYAMVGQPGTQVLDIAFNVSSLVDTGVGASTINYANSFVTHSAPVMNGTAMNSVQTGWSTTNVTFLLYSAEPSALADGYFALHVCGVLA